MRKIGAGVVWCRAAGGLVWSANPCWCRVDGFVSARGLLGKGAWVRGCVDAWRAWWLARPVGQLQTTQRRRDAGIRGQCVLRVRVPCLPSRNDGCCCQSPWLQPRGDRGLDIIRFAEREAAARAGGGGEREREWGVRRTQGADWRSAAGRGGAREARAGRSRLGARRGERKGLGRVLLFLFCSVGSERKREQTAPRPTTTRRPHADADEVRRSNGSTSSKQQAVRLAVL